MHQVVQAPAERHDVVVCLVLLADRRLGRGERLEEAPEEPDVQMLDRCRHRAVVKLFRAERFEVLASRHRAASYEAESASARTIAGRSSPNGIASSVSTPARSNSAIRSGRPAMSVHTAFDSI